MNIVIWFVFLNIVNVLFINAISQNRKLNYNFNLKRFVLRCVVFKEKKLAKIIKKISNNFEIYHNKSIVSIAEGIITYNDLSEDEKTLIETIISLCY